MNNKAGEIDFPTVEVEADFFSGRPNPRWRLSVEELQELKRRLVDLSPAEAAPAPPALGYRGFRLTSDGDVADLPPAIHVFASVLSIARNGVTDHLLDGKRIESWLLDQARARGLPSPPM